MDLPPCPLCGNPEYDREEERTDTRWGLSTHIKVLLICTQCEVQISHHDRAATVLRGAVAARFLVDVRDHDPQELMARLTGTYRRGNERMGKNHPRNRRH